MNTSKLAFVPADLSEDNRRELLRAYDDLASVLAQPRIRSAAWTAKRDAAQVVYAEAAKRILGHTHVPHPDEVSHDG
jgi:hypothetical protein